MTLSSSATCGRRCSSGSISARCACPGGIGPCSRPLLPRFSFFRESFPRCCTTCKEGVAMNKHPYLRAYLAGIAVPTVVLLVGMTAYTIIRYVWDVPIPIERVIVFPMAAVPNAWGLWNVLYRACFAGRRVSLGVFGAALLLLVIPC